MCAVAGSAYLVSVLTAPALCLTDTAVFMTANYQCNDGHGPTIAEQLKMNPFQVVIGSIELTKEHGGEGMVAVHSTLLTLAQ